LDTGEIIKPSEGEIIQLLQSGVTGFLSKLENEDKFYLNRDKELGEHILVDGILSKVISRKDNIYKVINCSEDEEIDKLKAELNKKLINGLRMTKKDAKKLFKKTSDSACYYYDSIRVVSLGQVDTILDKIFEESEKQKVLRMTKKDAEKLFKKSADSAYYYYDNTKVVSLGQVDTILDKIFEESEKQLEDKVLDKEQL
jgi:hypothetical protein